MKKLISLIVFLIILVAGTVWVYMAPSKTQPSNQKLLPPINKEEVQKITLTKNDTQIAVVQKENDTWTSVLPEPYPAEQDLVEMFLNALGTLSKGTVVSKNPDKAYVYGVDDASGLKISVEDGNQNELTSFIVGKAGNQVGTRFFRLPNNSTVYQSDAASFANIDRKGIDWRKTDVVVVQKSSIKNIVIQQKDLPPITLTQGDTWTVDGLEGADESTITNMVANLTNIHTVDFPEKKDLSEYGLDKEDIVILYSLQDGSTIKLIIGATDESENRFARVDGNDTIFKIGKGTLDTFLNALQK